MTREEAIANLKQSKEYCVCACVEALDMALEALKTLDEIIEYMNDKTVTWRDISDDIINSILEKHNWKE